MTVNVEAPRTLDPQDLPKFPGLKVLAINVEDLTDWTGDPALRVSVLLDESVDIEKVTGQEVGDLKFAIRQRLREHGVALFAYIFLAKPSELLDHDEE